MGSATRVAVLMACHNRRTSTLASLKGIFGQKVGSNIKLEVYLVDDGSTDGTSDVVQAAYPNTRIIKGDGNLFWNGAMRLAFSEASKINHDYYLWLNDDTTLEPDAVANLLSAHHHLTKRNKPNSIIAGRIHDPATGVLTYGGVVRKSRLWPLKFRWLETDGEMQECDTMDGNCVLIPRTVVNLVGNLDETFTHGMGDWDYGLRARKLGCSVWVAPGYAGTSPRNPAYENWMSTDLPLRKRLKKVNHPKGLPTREWKVYVRRHAGPLWYLYWIYPYAYLFIAPTLKRIHGVVKGFYRNNPEGLG